MTEKDLFETYQKDVYKTCYYMLQHFSDAEDVCQEVFITAFRHDWRNVKHVKAWLIKVAMNHSLNHLRKNHRMKRKEDQLLQHVSMKTEKSAEAVAEEQESANEYLRLLSALPIKIRPVVLLRYLHEYSINEISEMMSIPAGTVKSRLNRGRTLIRRMITSPTNKGRGIMNEQHG